MGSRLFIMWMLVALPLLAQEAPQLGFSPMVTETLFPPFSETLAEQHWGQNSLEAAIRAQAPHLSISHNLSSRYFAIAQVKEIEYWECKLIPKKGQQEVTAFLAKVQLLLLVHDVECQEVKLRQLWNGYAAVSSKTPDTIETRGKCLQRAFGESLHRAALSMAQLFPSRGVVRYNIAYSLGDEGDRKRKHLEEASKIPIAAVVFSKSLMQKPPLAPSPYEKFLYARLAKTSLRHGELLGFSFLWSKGAPRKPWYVYIFYLDDSDTHQAYLAFPNRAIREKQVKPGESYSFPNQEIWETDIIAQLPTGVASAHDRILLLLAEEKISFLEHRLNEGIQKGQASISLLDEELKFLSTQLQVQGKLWSSAILHFEIVK